MARAVGGYSAAVTDPRAQGGDELADRVKAAREGCRFAFDDVMRATYDDTYRLALRLTGNHADASEVAQDTYVRAFRYLCRFRGDSSVATWLYRITSNCASTLRSRRRRHRHSELTHDVQVRDHRPDHDPESVALGADLEARLRIAVALLPARLRDVLILRDTHELTHQEIAKRIGISESAAKVRLHRARRKLRSAVFDDIDNPHDDGPATLPVSRRRAVGRDEQAVDLDETVLPVRPRRGRGEAA